MALSCYQPCREHIAQPARCLDEEEERIYAATLALRRRQFIERCHEARANRLRDTVPEVKVSVRKTREELTKHASQTTPLSRRLTVETGWSKVEEVRKKFEAAAAAESYSRSFESPPRRRLADSLFASFKLPRKKDSMAAPRSAPQHQQKRKSAVELLAETKAFYVKSETVLDRKQELPLRVSSGLSQAIAAGGCHLVSSGALSNENCCNPYATTGRVSRRAVCGGEGLQGTLRRLLEHADSRENVYSPPFITHKVYDRRKDYSDTIPRSAHNSGTFSGTSSSGTSGSKTKEELKNRPLSFGDARVFFPESFVIPRQRCDQDRVVIKTGYSINSMPASSHSSLENMELPEPVVSGSGSPADPMDAISPPAQYAHSAPRYIRSNSHSQPSMREDDASTNINSHKSLPDLHTQARNYTEHTHTGHTETIGRSPRRRRHSSHQRTASCSSKGTRSNHSSLMSSCDAFSEHPSPGEENYQSYTSRCGSSFARDSGGSSGHYTQRSAPPHAQHTQHQHRTDSGSSTQHEHASRYNCYYGEWGAPELDCYVSAPPQFQDGAPSPPAPLPPPHYPPHPPVGIHFQASAPPPQFQDEPPLYDYGDYECSYKNQVKCVSMPRKDYTARDYNRYHEQSREEILKQQPLYAEVRKRPPRIDDNKDYVNSAQINCPSEEVTSPLGTFKRQRCLRYKQRRPRPILRSKSDISDRYRRTDGRSSASAPCDGDDSPDSPSEDSSRLRQFFERLGLQERQYEALVSAPPDSPVFFSSASTVDSNALPATADYTINCPSEEVTSPLGTFKRQRCLRYKQRRPRPILRSKSDISDRYRRTDGRSSASAPCDGDDSPDSPSEDSSRLRQFFERLGLQERQYEALVSAPPDSPVFFSSASTVDSNALPATADYTVQGPGGVQKQIYRNTEPPSVVERNARIIKWLCQCRKTQLQPPQ